MERQREEEDGVTERLRKEEDGVTDRARLGEERVQRMNSSNPR